MKEDSRKVLKSMMMVTQLGIVMMVPIFLCGALGVWLNRLTGIDIIFPILLVLGIGSGFRSVYMVTKSFYASDKKKENEKLQYMEDLKNYRNIHPDEDFSDVMEGKINCKYYQTYKIHNKKKREPKHNTRHNY